MLDFLCPAITAFVAGIAVIPAVQILLHFLIGRRREKGWVWREVLTRRLDSWKTFLVGLFIGTAALACGFSGVNVNTTGPGAPLVPLWVLALVLLTQLALPFVTGMIICTYALARWGLPSRR